MIQFWRTKNIFTQPHRQEQDVTLGEFLSGIPYLPTPPLGQDMTQGQFLSGV